MSLDFYLEGEVEEVECVCPNCEHRHSNLRSEQLFSSNITHNLNSMAGEAGIYDCLWRPDEHGITHAKQMIEPLQKGIILLKSDPERFKAFNAKNGWGKYENFVPWVEDVLHACITHPDAKVSVSR